MELTVEMMKKLLDSAIINNEDVERAQIETIKEALMNKYGIKAPKLTQRKIEKDMYVIFRENMLFQVDLKGHKSVAVHRRSA